MLSELTTRAEAGVELDVLVWRLPRTMLSISSAAAGGGVGTRQWALNAQVRDDYQRVDLEAHVRELAADLALTGDGVGMLTAARVARVARAQDLGVEVEATVGLTHPTWAADDQIVATTSLAPGTINIVAFVPVRLDEAALVNAVTTVTEAKAQALFDAAVPATGTASDALCILCPLEGEVERFAGPRSVWGSRLARAAHHAVLVGARA